MPSRNQKAFTCGCYQACLAAVFVLVSATVGFQSVSHFRTVYYCRQACSEAAAVSASLEAYQMNCWRVPAAKEVNHSYPDCQLVELSSSCLQEVEVMVAAKEVVPRVGFS
mmetsp:Transcript_18665/g.32721  ORF Transcript_18665/g.32721 Transcript_18665/m.32721 type:complete len:110 (+) Transcript_18665:257-586(+)